MKIFIHYLKGLAAVFYHFIPMLLYCSAFYSFYQTCIKVNGTAALWLACGLFSLVIAVILTFVYGYRFFDSVFLTKKKLGPAADKDKKNF